MYDDCVSCGVYGFCNSKGVCMDCISEGIEDGEEAEAEEA